MILYEYQAVIVVSREVMSTYIEAHSFCFIYLLLKYVVPTAENLM